MFNEYVSISTLKNLQATLENLHTLSKSSSESQDGQLALATCDIITRTLETQLEFISEKLQASKAETRNYTLLCFEEDVLI